MDSNRLGLAPDLLRGAIAAASYLGVSPRMIYHMVEKGRLPVTRMGKRMYFRKSELEAAFVGAAQEAEPSKAAKPSKAQKAPVELPDGLAFGDVIRMIADRYSVPASALDTLTSRVKMFQKRGFPTGRSLGRGRRECYSEGEANALVVALGLNLMGITPELAIYLVRESHSVWSAGRTGDISFEISPSGYSSAAGSVTLKGKQ